ncbi:MAG: helix-turn-helix domain-containing protein [Lachnospiraceae bacterium]|nr:helix-turn-helix domain-containing protein [Lachnospiraceae bacterium]
MPRVTINKKQYKIKDLAGWIEGKMHSRGLKQEDVARELGISQSSLSVRLNPKTYEKNRRADPFSYGDLLVLFDILDVTKEEREWLLTL